jgi:hypothetical protein
MAAPSPPSVTPDDPKRCASCGADASGRFCSSCGAALAGTNCAACGASLTPGAKFCHRCGARVGDTVVRDGEQRSFSSALPWAVAGIALVALVALVAGQRFAASRSDSSAPPQQVADRVNTDAGAAPPGRPPDISSLTPAERATRLYNRVMSAHERGFPDTVQMFAPMAITAFQMIGSLDADQRYDLGRLAAVAGDASIAAAQADTILRQNQNHLLGLILAANAAHMRRDSAAERSFHQRLVAAAPAERAKSLPEYAAHENDITIALGSGRP